MCAVNFIQISKIVVLNWSANCRSKSKFNRRSTSPGIPMAFHEVRSVGHATEGDIPSTPSIQGETQLVSDTIGEKQNSTKESALRKLYP